MLLQPYNEMNIYKRVEDRHARAVKVRHDFDKPREQIVEYFRPDLTDVVDNKGRLFESTNVYNGDPAYAGRVMTQGVFAGMCNPAQPWRRFKLPEKHLDDDNDTREWMQQLDQIMLDTYSQRDSSFYRALARYFHAKFTVGSPVMIVEKHPTESRIVYTSPHHNQYWVIRDYFGEIVGLHIVYKMPAIEVYDTFAGSEHLFPMTLKHAMQSGSHWDEWEILQSFYRVKDRIFRDRPKTDVEIMQHRPWVCMWQLRHTDQDKEEPLQIRYYRSRPFVVGDWDLNPNEAYSRTPAWHAMIDVKSEQRAFRSQIQLAELKARPPIWALARLATKINRMPGQTTYVGEDEFQYAPQPFGHEGDYMVADHMWEKLGEACRRWFFVGYFLQLTTMVQNKQAPPTATQIIDMDAEKLTQLSGGIQGIETQDLWPIDDRVFEILYRDGAMPEPPDAYLYEGSGELIPQFEGALSQAQRLNTMLSRVRTGMELVMPFLALDEMAVHKIKVPDMVEKILEEVGVWQDTLRDRREYEDIVSGILEDRARQQAMIEGKTKADTLKSLGGKADRSSPLAEMMQR